MGIAALRRSGHLPSLLGAFAYFDVSFMVWMLLGALGVYVAGDLRLSPAQQGLVVAVPALGGAAFRLVLGGLADHLGMRRVGLAGLLLTLVPLGWGALAGGTLWQVLLIGLLLGVAGGSFAVALPLVSRWYPPERQGLALGVVGAGNSGTLVAALAAPRLAEQVGWHGVFALAAIPVLLVLVLFAVAVREPPRRGVPSRPLSVVRQPDVRWVGAVYAVTFGGFVGLAAYLPIFFVGRFGLAKVTVGALVALCAGSGSVLRPVGGLLADRAGGQRVLSAVLALAALAAAAAATATSVAGSVAAIAVLVGMLGLGNGAVFQLVPQRFPADVGSVTGFVGAAGGAGGFALPFAFGALRQVTGSFAPGFLAFGAVAAATCVSVRRRASHRVAGDQLAPVGVAA